MDSTKNAPLPSVAPAPSALMAKAREPGEDQAGPDRDPIVLQRRIRQLEATMQALLASLNGASIACDPDDSTITLTFPDLPSA